MFAQLKPYAIGSLLIPFLISSSNANAVFIDFDDIIPYESNDPFCEVNCMHELSNEYQSKGLIFHGGTLRGGTLPDGTQKNGVRGFNQIDFEFTGSLPNFLSFNHHSGAGVESSYIDIYGENGVYLFTHFSSGWRGDEDLSTPYIPNELVAIYSTEKIKSVSIYSFFGLRTGPYIDNLTFEVRNLPEPSPLILFLLSITGIFLRKINFIKNR